MDGKAGRFARPAGGTQRGGREGVSRRFGERSRHVLVERQAAREGISTSLAQAQAGFGNVVVVVGEAGSGKSQMLREARALAGEREMTTLHGRGARRTDQRPYDLVRQIFGEIVRRRPEIFAGPAEPALAVMDVRPQQGGDTAADEAAIDRALAWVVATLSDAGPVTVVVDDIDEADAASLRWLRFLTGQLDGLRVTLIVSLTRQHGPAADLVSEVTADPHAKILWLEELGAEGVQAMTRACGLGEAAPAFVAAAIRETSGNLLLLTELLAELRRRRLPPNAASSAELERITPRAIVNSTRGRLSRLGTDAARLAHVMVLLGPDLTFGRAWRATGIDAERASDLLVALADAGICGRDAELQIRSPMIARALAAALPAAWHDDLRQAVASVLVADGAPVEHAAEHVLATRPTGREASVELLRAAARSSAARGDTRRAERYLTRAVEESDAGALRGQPAAELACVRVVLGRTGATARLDGALDDLPDDAARCAQLAWLGELLLASGAARPAAGAFERALDVLGRGDDDLRADLEAGFAIAAVELPPLAAPARRRLAAWIGESARITPKLGVRLAAELAHSGLPHDQGLRLVRHALDGGLLDDRSPVGGEAALLAASVLSWCDDLPGAAEVCDALKAPWRPPAVATAADAQLAWLALSTGRIADAARIAEAVLSRPHAARRPSVGSLAAAARVFACLELGELDDAHAAVREGNQICRPGELSELHVREAEGWWLLETGEDERGLAAFRRSIEIAQSAGISNPAVSAAGLGVVAALVRLGHADEAEGAARELLQVARMCGAPRALAAALRTAALVHDRDEALVLLEEALQVVEGTGAELERTRCLLAHGSLLRRLNRRAQARAPLSLALDRAHRQGATQMARRARVELNSAGVRPRRPYSLGWEALTPSELRVAEHAARGLTNRQIATALFLTPKTVEWHLRNVFIKLQVRRRSELPAALAAQPAAPGQSSRPRGARP